MTDFSKEEGPKEAYISRYDNVSSSLKMSPGKFGPSKNWIAEHSHFPFSLRPHHLIQRGSIRAAVIPILPLPLKPTAADAQTALTWAPLWCTLSATRLLSSCVLFPSAHHAHPRASSVCLTFPTPPPLLLGTATAVLLRRPSPFSACRLARKSST
ncbi:hypothetical protein K438DRAFT_1997372 [Mycena galopus ATCC 62051]|nr:hypothetical protein K438DRAFT_1997372 [Mycena galopus ATCC 62051]